MQKIQGKVSQDIIKILLDYFFNYSYLTLNTNSYSALLQICTFSLVYLNYF